MSAEDIVIIEEERKYRSDTEILYEILHTIMSSGDRGIKKTHLMYKTNLNSKMLARYLDMLLRANLIEEVQFGKHKIVRLTPLGKHAYVNLRVLKKLLFDTEEPREMSYVKSELTKLGKYRWNIHFGRIILGRSGLEYLPTATMVKDTGGRYMIDVYLGVRGLEARALLMHFLMGVADSGYKGLVLAEEPELEKAVPSRLKDMVIVLPLRPLDTLLERVLKAIGEEPE